MLSHRQVNKIRGVGCLTWDHSAVWTVWIVSRGRPRPLVIPSPGFVSLYQAVLARIDLVYFAMSITCIEDEGWISLLEAEWRRLTSGQNPKCLQELADKLRVRLPGGVGWDAQRVWWNLHGSAKHMPPLKVLKIRYFL